MLKNLYLDSKVFSQSKINLSNCIIIKLIIKKFWENTNLKLKSIKCLIKKKNKNYKKNLTWLRYWNGKYCKLKKPIIWTKKYKSRPIYWLKKENNPKCDSKWYKISLWNRKIEMKTKSCLF